MRPAKKPTYLKRVVKEKWDEVHRLRKRRVRWTIGRDKIDVDYEVGTNTAALLTVNALFHSIVSTDPTLSGAPIPHSLPGPAYTVSQTTSPPTPFTPLANSVLPSPVPTTATLGPLTGIALLPLAQPLLTTAVNVLMSSPPALNASPLPYLAHFPLPLFHFGLDRNGRDRRRL